MPNITHALQTVHDQIAELEHRYQRTPGSVTLLAVSKTKPLAAVLEAHAAGQNDFGENHLQDALTKMDKFPGDSINWHFIGPVQSNKTRQIATRFAWVHSIDRLKIAERLNEQRSADLKPLNICIQVNLSGEQSKSGVHPEQLPELAAAIDEFPNLTLRGLMTLPQPSNDLATQRSPFALLRKLRDDLRATHSSMDSLSMGMTNDLEAAIAEGSTIVRIGTAIFGARSSAPKLA